MHGTLNSIIARSVEQKGNWAEIVPMAVFFYEVHAQQISGCESILVKTRVGAHNALAVPLQGVVSDKFGRG